VFYFYMLIVTNFLDLDLTKQYTYTDDLLWQFSERVELINGRKYKSPLFPKMQIAIKDVSEDA
jgi:hypothetical protein